MSMCYNYLIFLFEVVYCSAFVKVVVSILDIDVASILLHEFTYFIFFVCLGEKDTRSVHTSIVGQNMGDTLCCLCVIFHELYTFFLKLCPGYLLSTP
jgi:hypothetical protein